MPLLPLTQSKLKAYTGYLYAFLVTEKTNFDSLRVFQLLS